MPDRPRDGDSAAVGKLDAGEHEEIAESIISGRQAGAEVARLFIVRPPIVSRIVAQYRVGPG